MANKDKADDINSGAIVVIERWQSTLALQNYSANTQAAYRAGMEQFVYFLNKIGVPWTACDKNTLELFLVKRLEQDLIKAVSAKQEMSAISKFYQFAIKEGLVSYNPAANHRLKSPPRKLPTIADVDMMGRLLDQEPPDDSEQLMLWVRDKAMFELLYSSGLRVSELVGLDVGDVDLSNASVRVLGKGNKTRIVPVGSQAVQAITDYLPYRTTWLDALDSSDNTGMSKETALFISPSRGRRLSQRAVQLRLKASAKNAGIDQNLYPHLLRHTFASHMLSESGDLRAVQEMLGHSDLKATQIYTHVDFGALTKIYDNTHPRAVKK